MNLSSFQPEVTPLPRLPVAAWIGLDWADQKHVICLYDVASGKVETTQLEHLAEALQEWVAQLRVRYREARVAVVLEQARGPVL
jgi:hypothetical protein